MPDVKCAFCFGVSVVTCKECGAEICGEHTENDRCIVGCTVLTPPAPAEEAPAPKPKKQRKTAKS